MRIVHIIAPGRFGGLESVVATLATGQQRRGHDVSVCAFVDQGTDESPLLVALRAAGVRVQALALPSRAYGSQVRAIREAAASLSPNVVHSHGYVPDVLVGFPKRRDFPPTATTAHGFTGGDRKNRMYEWLQRRAHRRFDAVVAVSRTVRERIVASGVDPARVHVVRNAWGASGSVEDAAVARAKLGVPDDRFSIGWVGRVSHEKGLDVLARALPELADIPLRLTVIGDGPERSRVAQLAGELGVADRIAWAGVVADAGQLFRAFDVLVLSSRTEGTPITLLEAMKAQVPVVATAVGGVPDVVTPAEALLVESENPSALAAAIRMVFLDRAAATERVHASRARLETAFAVEPWLDAYDRIYHGIQAVPR